MQNRPRHCERKLTLGNSSHFYVFHPLIVTATTKSSRKLIVFVLFNTLIESVPKEWCKIGALNGRFFEPCPSRTGEVIS